MVQPYPLSKTQEQDVRAKFGEAALDALVDVLLSRAQAKTKAVSATASYAYLHGPGSLLGVLGLPQAFRNAMILPVKGLQTELQYMRSDFENELFTIMTGQTASTGTEPTANCMDSTEPGALKICSQVWPFGRLQKDSQVLDVTMTNRLINRGEFIDPTIVGNPFQDLLPKGLPVNPLAAFKDDASKKLTELFVAMYRDYGHVNYDGNPGNTGASTGGYLEWNGLDRLFNTGYQDAISGKPCPAADSMVRSFNNLLMNTNALALVQEISEMIRAQKYLAERTGQAPVEYAFNMRYSAFLVLTEVWPCAYFTVMCTNLQTGARDFVNAERQLQLRNEMREGMYIVTVFGDKIPVIIDDFIIENNPLPGTFQSDIYLLPKVAGGRPATYFQFFNWDGPAAAVEIGNLLAPPGTFTTAAGGRYLMVKKMPNNTCVQVQAIEKKRLICETPFLAARLTNCRYTVTIHEREPLTTAPYFVDGGQYYNYPPYFYPAYPG
jgi:hypothetical protein